MSPDDTTARAIFRGSAATSVHFIFDPSCAACQDLYPHIRGLESKMDVVYHATTILDRSSVDAVVALEFAGARGQLPDMLDFQHDFFRANRRVPRTSEIGSAGVYDPDSSESFAAFVSDPTNRLRVLGERNRLVETGVTAVPTVLYRGRVLVGNRPDCLDELLKPLQ